MMHKSKMAALKTHQKWAGINKIKP